MSSSCRLAIYVLISSSTLSASTFKDPSRCSSLAIFSTRDDFESRLRAFQWAKTSFFHFQKAWCWSEWRYFRNKRDFSFICFRVSAHAFIWLRAFGSIEKSEFLKMPNTRNLHIVSFWRVILSSTFSSISCYWCPFLLRISIRASFSFLALSSSIATGPSVFTSLAISSFL